MSKGEERRVQGRGKAGAREMEGNESRGKAGRRSQWLWGREGYIIYPVKSFSARATNRRGRQTTWLARAAWAIKLRPASGLISFFSFCGCGSFLLKRARARASEPPPPPSFGVCSDWSVWPRVCHRRNRGLDNHPHQLVLLPRQTRHCSRYKWQPYQPAARTHLL